VDLIRRLCLGICGLTLLSLICITQGQPAAAAKRPMASQILTGGIARVVFNGSLAAVSVSLEETV
jgi:hypothetical protein